MRIETERLVLREFRPADQAAMAAYWADPLYQRYYAELADHDAVVAELVARFIAAQAAQPRRAWQMAITLRGDDQLIGNCGIRINNPELREANIGYELHPAHWGHGYASEAAHAIVRFGFEDIGLHRIWAETVADNLGSQRVLEKLGMRREAHFREHQWYRDRWWDTLIYALLDREWRARQRTPEPYRQAAP
jgi:RimJ/RimL family protein N-acetyltransferase